MFRFFKSVSVLAIVLSFLIIPPFTQTPFAQANDGNVNAGKISFMYLYGGSTTEYIQQIQATQGSVNVVSPNFYELDPNGDLVTNIDQKLISFMQKQQIKVVPYLSNHWDQASAQKALQKPQKLAADLANSVISNNLAGVNIDLENLTFADRTQLTNFVAILKSKLAPTGKTVSIAVGSIDKPAYSGWKSVYDLPNLSKVVDYLIIMAYDQHWRTSGPGPVASLPWVQAQLDYMLTQIPKNKVVLGVPFYGRVWTNDQNGGGIWHSDVIKASNENNANIQWHDEYQVPYVKYTKADGNIKEIWFENYYSINKKINLAKKYDLKGVAAWRLGQEDPSIWQDFTSWLNGSSLNNNSFTDTVNHWAQNDIEYLKDQGYISGRDNSHFAPDASVTRAEAVAILSRIFEWPANTNNPFTDVANHWAQEPILTAYSNNIVRGLSADKFGPDEKLTRAQLAVILQRAFALEASKEADYSFIDVPQGHWAAKEIYTLKDLALVVGRTKTKYAPAEYVTRAELAAMLSRIIK